MLKFASRELKNNEQIVTIVVTQDIYTLKFASSDEMKNNLQVVIVTVKAYGGMLQCVFNELKYNV